MKLLCTVKELGKERAVLEPRLRTVDGTSECSVTAADLICALVTGEVEQYNSDCCAPTIFAVLSPNQIVTSAENSGKVGFGVRYNRTEANLKSSIDEALLAFKDGLYYMFVDDKKVESLNDSLKLNEQSELMFLKLTMLTGR